MILIPYWLIWVLLLALCIYCWIQHGREQDKRLAELLDGMAGYLEKEKV